MKIKITFIVLFLLHLVLRIKGLGAQSYWIDEIVSADFSSFPSWGSLFWDNHPPLYHFIMKVWIYFFGSAETVVRLLSVIFSAATFIFLWDLSKEYRLLTRIFILSLFSFSGAEILMAQEARMYALFELTVIFNLWAYRRSKYYIFSCVAMLLTHYFSLLILFGHILLHFQSSKAVKKSVYFLLGWLALLTTIILFFIDWKYLRWQGQSFNLASFGPEAKQFSQDLFWGLPYLGFALVPWFFYSWYKKKDDIHLIISVCLLGLAIFQIGAQKNLLFVRYFAFLVPLFCLSLGQTFEAGKKGVALLLLPAIFYLPQIYTYRKAPWRDVSQYILEHQGGRVLTTRTLALRTPYFTFPIKLEKWDSSIEQILKIQDRPIWIVESYWSGVTLLPHLKDELEKQGISAEILTFQKEESDRILVLTIPLK